MEEKELWRIYEIGQKAYLRGDLEKAISIFQELLPDRLPSSLRAAVLNDLGVAWQRKGDRERARQAYEEALAIERSLGESEKLGTLLINLAGCYAELEHPKEAIKAYEEGLLFLENMGGDLALRGQAWRKLGSLYLSQRSENKALWALRNSFYTWQEKENKREMAVTLQRIGDAYSAKYKWPEAVGSYMQAVTLWEALDDRRALAAAYLGLGRIYFDWERFQQAKQNYQRALDIAQEIGDTEIQARALISLGQVCTHTKEWEEGLNFYQKAISIKEEKADRRGLALVLWSRATLLFEKGDKSQAIADMEKTVAILEELQDPERSRARQDLTAFRRKRPGPISRYF